MAIRPMRATSALRKDTEPCEHYAGSSASAQRPRKRLRRLARRLLAVACLGLVVTSTGGCSITRGTINAFRDSKCLDEFMVGYRNRAMAEKAWHCRKEGFSSYMYEKDFKQGFIDGYIEIAEGGPGCCPSIAPSRYWGWQYQSAHGQQAINAWFAGYPLGVVAAEEEGIGNFNQIFVLGGTNANGTATGSGACNNCGTTRSSVPSMSDREMVPAPVADPQIPAPQGVEIEMIVPPPAGAPLGVNQAPGVASEFIANRAANADAGLIDTQLMDIEFNAPIGSTSTELQLTPSTPAPNQLPFTFE